MNVGIIPLYVYNCIKLLNRIKLLKKFGTHKYLSFLTVKNKQIYTIDSRKSIFVSPVRSKTRPYIPLIFRGDLRLLYMFPLVLLFTCWEESRKPLHPSVPFDYRGLNLFFCPFMSLSVGWTRPTFDHIPILLDLKLTV